MIDKFHCDKGGEPRRSGLREEFVMVGCYVEGTDLVGKISLEDGGEKGDCVDQENDREVDGEKYEVD